MSDELFSPYMTPILKEILNVWHTHYRNAGSPSDHIAKEVVERDGKKVEIDVHDSTEIRYEQFITSGPDEEGNGEGIEQVTITIKGFQIDNGNQNQSFLFDSDDRLYILKKKDVPKEILVPDQGYSVALSNDVEEVAYTTPTFSVNEMLSAALREADYFDKVTSHVRGNLEELLAYDCDMMFDLTKRHLRYLGDRMVLEDIKNGSDIEECLRRESRTIYAPKNRVMSFNEAVKDLQEAHTVALFTTEAHAEDCLIHWYSDEEMMSSYKAWVDHTEVLFLEDSRRFFDKHLEELRDSGYRYLCVVSNKKARLIDWRTGLQVEDYAAKNFDALVKDLPDVLQVALFANEAKTIGILQSLPFDEKAIENHMITAMGQEIKLVSSSRKASDDYRDAILTSDIFKFLSGYLNEDYQFVKRAVALAKSTKTVRRRSQLLGIIMAAKKDEDNPQHPEEVLYYTEMQDFWEDRKTECSVMPDAM
jgi:hypothetical protein